MGHIMLKVLRGICSMAYGFYWYIEGMERKKVRVGDRTIKMHEGRGLLGRYLIAKIAVIQFLQKTCLEWYKCNACVINS